MKCSSESFHYHNIHSPPIALPLPHVALNWMTTLDNFITLLLSALPSIWASSQAVVYIKERMDWKLNFCLFLCSLSATSNIIETKDWPTAIFQTDSFKHCNLFIADWCSWKLISLQSTCSFFKARPAFFFLTKVHSTGGKAELRCYLI